MQYKCPKCKKPFDVRSNSVLDSINIPGAHIVGINSDVQCSNCGAIISLRDALESASSDKNKKWWKFWK